MRESCGGRGERGVGRYNWRKRSNILCDLRLEDEQHTHTHTHKPTHIVFDPKLVVQYLIIIDFCWHTLFSLRYRYPGTTRILTSRTLNHKTYPVFTGLDFDVFRAYLGLFKQEMWFSTKFWNLMSWNFVYLLKISVHVYLKIWIFPKFCGEKAIKGWLILPK